MPRPLFLAMVLLLAPGWTAFSQEADADEAEFFERKIRPVLVEHCYACHSTEAAARKKLRGGLLVDSREGLILGGDSGPAVAPGKPDESLLVAALRQGDDLKMPPEGKLPEAVVADFVDWVRRGAPDPRSGPTTLARAVDKNPRAGRDHWAYRPPVDVAPPPVRDASWPAGAIDRLLLARLEAAGLRPAAEADRTALIRRLSFDLTGLPPTIEEIDSFLHDSSPLAYERLVDRLLASPHFGERWGRHWLDVARFAESLTLRGLALKEAWRYRDYVIDAFNADMPFDRFLREQIAGDLLPDEGLESRRRRRIAVTFLLLGDANLEDQDKVQLEMDLVDDYGFHSNEPRRSVYAPVFRNALPEIFTALDFADPSMVVGRRNASIVAPQALFLMNNPFVLEQARYAARRLIAESAGDSDRLNAAYRRVLGRPPTGPERRIMLDFLARSSADGVEDAWAHVVHALFESADFRSF